MSVPEVEQAILERLAEGLHERFGRISAEEATRIDPAWFADVMLGAIPTEHPFGALGPFYDTPGLVGWLGVTRQALHQRVKSHQVLACVTGDGQRVYPAWQFTPDGRVLPGLGEVLQVLLPATDPWTAALWLTAPSEALGDESAVAWLRRHPDHALVLADARADAARWAQ